MFAVRSRKLRAAAQDMGEDFIGGDLSCGADAADYMKRRLGLWSKGERIRDWLFLWFLDFLLLWFLDL